jgi:prepilin-type N-terminal cleavage/methylation domain-containing protein
MKSLKQKQRGFTIIEVVLVLAIAGLIFLIVFLAVPSLQRSQRDTQRRSDLGRVLSQISQYQANTGGQTPQTQQELNTFRNSYMKANQGEFLSPDGGTYSLLLRNNGVNPAAGGPNTMNYYVNASCSGASIGSGNGPRSIAVAMALEGGGVACQDNQ